MGINIIQHWDSITINRIHAVNLGLKRRDELCCIIRGIKSKYPIKVLELTKTGLP